jgi:hypothetical protein
MNIFIIISILLTLLIIYTLVNSYTYLNHDTTIYNSFFDKINNNDDNDKNNFIKEELLIKYSSIKNKLETNEDYINFNITMNDSMYVSIIDNHIYDDNQIVELISNDITKTKLQYNFDKLKDIYIINKIHNNYNKLIIIYDGLKFNKKHITFNKNDLSGNTIIYKLNIKNKIISHLLQ